MNSMFNPKRFGRLFIKHTSEHYKTYLMAMAVLVGVFLLGGSLMVYIIPGPMDTEVQNTLFVGLFMLAGTLFTSTIFSDLGDQKKALANLMLPATHFEKYLVGWLYSYVIFQVIFITSFYLCLVMLLNIRHWPGIPIQYFDVFDERRAPVFLMYAVLQSMGLFGAIFFKKLHFIKTGFCFFIGLAVLIIINTVAVEAMIGRKVNAVLPFGFVNFSDGDSYRSIAVSDTNNFWGLYLMVIITLIFWSAAYFRLKEKQL